MNGNTLAAVSAEEYFAGNTDDMSFGRHVQTSREIPVTEYAETCRNIRAKPDVEAIYVIVHEVPDDNDPVEYDEWPSAFRFVIITSAPAGVVENWLRPLEPRYADDAWKISSGVSVPWPEPPAGMWPVLVEML